MSNTELQVIVLLALSFWTGGFVSFYATKQFKCNAMLFNATILFLIGGKLVADLMKKK